MKRPIVLFAVTSLCLFLASSSAQVSANSPGPLYQGFLDPPHDYSPMPFWFWNGKMDDSQIRKEIHDMVDQHVYGAFLHARDGLQTPYLSEDWWKAIGAGLEESKKDGFEFNFVDEYDWPSGEARNIWMTGNHQSEVLARRPDFRMKTLEYESKIVQGPQAIDLPLDPDSQAVVAARWVGKDHIDGTSLRLLNWDSAGTHTRWPVPEGQWIIVQFHLAPARGIDNDFVDLMNPDAMKLYFQLSYGEYYRRFGSYFGNTIHYSFSDHEGDYGYRIAWTPSLFSTFQERTGYDLRKVLPLLIYDGGDLTTKVRTDYLSTVTQLYAASFWNGITNSAKDLGIHRTGHDWEESLQWATALNGSLFSVERGLDPVGVDSLFDYGRQPLNFKVAQSVADFEGRRFACENQGVQGTGSYLDLENMRKATNAIGAWGVNLFVPHAFNYDAGRANYPPDWLHQPYWQYFHYYADYVRRISYMNAEGQHVTNVLLYYPITSIWAHTAPLFSGDADYQDIGHPAAWRNQTILINDYYSRIILELANHQWDYNIADDQYLAGAHIEGNELVIGPQRFRAVILPPITTLSRKTLKVLQDFHQAGGTVFAIRSLPDSSPEAGGNDALIKTGVAELFGTSDGHMQILPDQQRSGSGHAFYLADSVDALIALLDAHVPKDVRIASGPGQHLFFEHRRKMKQDYYWAVNDTDRARINEVRFSSEGVPEKWNALTGKREPLFYTNGPSGTTVRLNLGPWDAYYVVFSPLVGSAQNVELVSTNAETIGNVSPHNDAIDVHVSAPVSASDTSVELRKDGRVYSTKLSADPLQPIALGGDWTFRPQPDQVSVPYAKVSSASEQQGENLGWTSAAFDDTDWPSLWLSEEQNTIRTWQVIGPFPNADSNGYAASYPPEKEFDPTKQYEGADSKILDWKNYFGDEPQLALKDWDIWMKTEGGRFSDAGYTVQLNRVLLTDAHSWIVSYAHTYLYSPRNQHAQFLVAADNWAHVWLNGKQVFEQLRTPYWYELNDKWADRIPVELHAGWNEVLIKVGEADGVASGIYGFSFRVADENGTSLPDVVGSIAQNDMKESAADENEMRWYRIPIPPGCISVTPLAFHRPYHLWANGKDVTPGAESAPVIIRGLLNNDQNILVIAADKDDRLDSPVTFITGETPFLLRSWIHTGLANFSGTAIYSKNFTVPESFGDKRVMIDLGRVSSVAEVSINNQPAGTLVWRPYQLDISKLIHPGENQIKIVITNTEANHRAVGTWHHILPAIDVDGLEGPVRIVPYVDRVVTLH